MARGLVPRGTRCPTRVAGETVELGAGDLATFGGDQAHSHADAANRESVGYSVVLLAPLAS